MDIFRSMLHSFLLFAPVPLTELWSLWYGLKDLFTLHKLADKVILDIKTGDITSSRGTWIDTGGYGRLRDE